MKLKLKYVYLRYIVLFLCYNCCYLHPLLLLFTTEEYAKITSDPVLWVSTLELRIKNPHLLN